MSKWVDVRNVWGSGLEMHWCHPESDVCLVSQKRRSNGLNSIDVIDASQQIENTFSKYSTPFYPIRSRSKDDTISIWFSTQTRESRPKPTRGIRLSLKCLPPLLHRGFTGTNHRDTTKTKHKPITARLTCTSLSPFLSHFSLFICPHHFITPSPPPPASTLYSPLSRAIGLLFMASPTEDALLYRTLEPSSRPTPFEDVAHNSYLGL